MSENTDIHDKFFLTRGCANMETDDPASNPSGTMLGCNKLDVHNWLKGIPRSINDGEIIEVRFKNTRKGYYRNVNKLNLEKGDIVAVEASPGHDIGVVSLIGELVALQLKKNNLHKKEALDELKIVYRKAKPVDIEKWRKAIWLEDSVMLKAREIAENLELSMKIGDVEFQGDKTKAIFYYIADERVDFRELIKVLADEFKIRIEMRQIGARQEAGRIGGIGTCGRELCCSTWISNFVSVTTNAARSQELSLNPLKLAGQCGKLKCCLNYELDCYIDAQRDFPSTEIRLKTAEGIAFHQKTDVYKAIMWYSYDQSSMNLMPVPVKRVKEIIELNKKGVTVQSLVNTDDSSNVKEAKLDYVVEQESITRFDNKKQRQKRRRKPKKRKNETKA